MKRRMATINFINDVPVQEDDASLTLTEDWFRFNNRFFKALLAGGTEAAALLPTDRVLMDDPECANWVRQYAANEAIFFDDFTNAYIAMSRLGTKLL